MLTRTPAPHKGTHARAHPPVGAPAGVPVRAPWHPGYFLRRNFLEPLSLSQTDAARVLGVSRRRLHEIVQCQRSMTPDTAIRCALAFGTDAAFWLALQAAWDNFHAWKSLRDRTNQAANPSLPSRFPGWQ